MRVSRPKKSRRVRTAITTSSSEVLPARSPRPLIVHSIWRAPPIITAASEFATAMPRSLWQCTDQTALSEFGMRSRRVRISSPNCSRHGVADRIRNVDRRRALLDHRLEHAAEEIEIRAAGVLGRELDVRAGVLAREAHRELRLLEHLVRRHAQLLLHVQRAGGDEGVDAPGLRALDRLDAALDVRVVGAAQAGHRRVLDHAWPPRCTASKSPLDAAGKPASITSTRMRSSCARDAQLLFPGHRSAGALLAVAHGGVEYDQVVLHGPLHGYGCE